MKFYKILLLMVFFSITAIKIFSGFYYPQSITSNETMQAFDAENWKLTNVNESNDLWNKTFVRCRGDSALSLIETTDGDYLLTGFTEVDNQDIWLIKTNKNGDILWNNTYGSEGEDFATSIIETADGYVLAGGMDNDMCLVKVDKNGSLLWNKTYGSKNTETYNQTHSIMTSHYETAFSVIETDDGGFLLAGRNETQITIRSDGQFDFYALNHGWVVKTDSNGNMLWNKSYTFSDNSIYSVHPSFRYIDYSTFSSSTIIKTDDNNYLLGGYLYSKEVYSGSLWFLEINENGDVLKNKTPSLSKSGYASDMIQTEDGGYLVTFVGENDNSHSVVMLAKIDTNIDIIWSKEYIIGGVSSLLKDSNDSYIMVGATNYYSINRSNCDIFVIKTDNKGKEQWKCLYGDNNDQWTGDAILTKDGNIVIAGTIRFGHDIVRYCDDGTIAIGFTDILLIKTNEEICMELAKQFPIKNTFGFSLITSILSMSSLYLFYVSRKKNRKRL